MRTIILILLFIAAGLWIALQVVQTNARNADIKARFIERVNYIPSIVSPSAFLSPDSLRDWLNNPANATARRTYAFPVLFPLDYFFLIALGLFLRFASLAFSSQLASLRTIPAWIWFVFPALYILCDLLEDTVLLSLFYAKLNLGPFVYYLLRTLTKAKIATVSAAVGQTAFLAALWALLRVCPAKP